MMPCCTPADVVRASWSLLHSVPKLCVCMQYVDKQLPYDNIGELRKRIADVAPHLVKNDTIESPLWLNGEYFKVC